MLIKPFFDTINSSTSKLFSPKFGIIDFKTLTPDAAFELWQNGFEYLIINPEGAKLYLSNKSFRELISLINNQKSKENIFAIASVSKLKSVKQAAKIKYQLLDR